MKGYVVLENGDVFEGTIHHYDEATSGELVFFTGATGHEKILTDPATKGQIIVFTQPLIGTCGIDEFQANSRIYANGFIAHDVANESFHYEAVMSLSAFSKRERVPFMTNVDTRALVKRIREHGEMKAVITLYPEDVSFEEKADVFSRRAEAPKTYGDGESHIVVIDYGFHPSFVSELVECGHKVTVVPHNISLKSLASLRPHTVIVSNGPGRPFLNENEEKTLRAIATTYPTIGIGLGHQLIALAFGAKIDTLKCGHRGISQPVIDVETNRVVMTMQNHRYVIDEKSLDETGFQVKFKNVHDRSIEGLVHRELPIVTMQFHPLAALGPADTKPYFLSTLQLLLSKGREKVYA